MVLTGVVLGVVFGLRQTTPSVPTASTPTATSRTTAVPMTTTPLGKINFLAKLDYSESFGLPKSKNDEYKNCSIL